MGHERSGQRSAAAALPGHPREPFCICWWQIFSRTAAATCRPLTARRRDVGQAARTDTAESGRAGWAQARSGTRLVGGWPVAEVRDAEITVVGGGAGRVAGSYVFSPAGEP